MVFQTHSKLGTNDLATHGSLEQYKMVETQFIRNPGLPLKTAGLSSFVTCFLMWWLKLLPHQQELMVWRRNWLSRTSRHKVRWSSREKTRVLFLPPLLCFWMHGYFVHMVNECTFNPCSMHFSGCLQEDFHISHPILQHSPFFSCSTCVLLSLEAVAVLAWFMSSVSPYRFKPQFFIPNKWCSR